MAAEVGSFTGTGQSASLTLGRGATLSLSGFGSATVILQRSFDQGTTWLSVKTFTADAERIVNGSGELWRLNCTVYGSGTILYRLGGA
jgi:hypothetical protein